MRFFFSSKNCPDKTDKAAKLMNSLQHLKGDLESLYYANEEIIFALQNSSFDERSPIESRDNEYFPIYSCKEIGSIVPTPPLPCVEVHVLCVKIFSFYEGHNLHGRQCSNNNDKYKHSP
ncbi:hypothetical protein MtrunA17_Chr2g0303631 [Medicago truncatula]|uniref:Uncharacterized protein n=1 Tax=Medicago truncatula TaxID=3880 RepID=Q2HSR0_MEDTR|nr:hypothetical protein MtrDRAFT_AC151520g1v2 [Medicago truncatula]RHN73903.1 hypothetical protein MtrunA17_Chr2g0303631 [Medicago truncatula]